MTTVAIVPARGQSKTLPWKNLRRLEGRPLIAHTIEAARASRRIERVVVSTDDDAIARAAVTAGAEVPFRRPAALAADESATIDAVMHAVSQLEDEGARIAVVVTLQPTSPFRTAEQIDAAIDLMYRTDADSAVSVAALEVPISVVGYVDAERFVQVAPLADARRQAAPTAYRLTGGIYVTTAGVLRTGRLIGERPAALVVDGATAIDIDTRADLDLARRAARARRSA